MSPEEHDKEMAWVHGLTFFVGRALLNMNPPQSELSTHYYQKLIDLVEVEKHHSTELFLTIQRGNPYAEAIRREFIDKISKLKHNVDESRDTI
jgi:prephenate dehydrogenase